MQIYTVFGSDFGANQHTVDVEVVKSPVDLDALPFGVYRLEKSRQ